MMLCLASLIYPYTYMCVLVSSAAKTTTLSAWGGIKIYLVNGQTYVDLCES